MALGRSIRIASFCLLMVGSPLVGAADPQRPPAAAATGHPVEILAELGDPPTRPSWLALELRRVDLNGKYGLVYARPLRIGTSGLELRVRGPALGRQRRVGLSFEARF